MWMFQQEIAGIATVEKYINEQNHIQYRVALLSPGKIKTFSASR